MGNRVSQVRKWKNYHTIDRRHIQKGSTLYSLVDSVYTSQGYTLRVHQLLTNYMFAYGCDLAQATQHLKAHWMTNEELDVADYPIFFHSVELDDWIIRKITGMLLEHHEITLNCIKSRSDRRKYIEEALEVLGF